MLIDITCHPDPLEQSDAHYHRDFKVGDLLDEGFEKTWCIHGASKKEINPRTDLLLHIHHLQVEDMAFGCCIDLGTDKELGFPFEIVAHEIIAFLEAFGGTEQAYYIEIKDGLGFKMISNGGVVTLEQEEILQAKGRGIEKFGLKGQPVSVATGEVIDDLDPLSPSAGRRPRRSPAS